jgi:hypothetical protein
MKTRIKFIVKQTPKEEVKTDAKDSSNESTN